VPVAPRGGFAFGASYLVQVSGAEGSAEDITMTSKIDSDMAQQLQRVSKRDSTTRLKALQSLLQIVQRKDAEDATSLIGAWSYVYAKLIMDVNRAVRAAAARVMGQLATTAGRALAPHLKSLVPYWYLQQYDEASEVAATAQSSFESAFAGSKAHDAILFCRHEVRRCTHYVHCLGVGTRLVAIFRLDTRRDAAMRMKMFFFCARALICFCKCVEA
jgi:hypothetical protein